MRSQSNNNILPHKNNNINNIGSKYHHHRNNTNYSNNNNSYNKAIARRNKFSKSKSYQTFNNNHQVNFHKLNLLMDLNKN